MENLEMNFRVEIGGMGFGSGNDVDKATFIREACVDTELAGELIGGFFTRHEEEESLKIMFFKRSRPVTDPSDLSRLSYIQGIDLYINAMRNDDYLDLVRSDVNIQRLDLIVNQYGAMLNHFNCGVGDNLDSAFSAILGESVYNQKPSIQVKIDIPLLNIELPCCIEPGIQIPSTALSGTEDSERIIFKPEDLVNEYDVVLSSSIGLDNEKSHKVEIISTQLLRGHQSNDKIKSVWVGCDHRFILQGILTNITDLERQIKSTNPKKIPELFLEERFVKIVNAVRGVNVVRELDNLKLVIKAKLSYL